MFRIIRREFAQLTKNRPEILLVLLGAALGYAFLVGNLYSGRILQNIPVAVCDLDGTNLSLELTQAISETDQFVFAGNVSSEIEAIELLERGAVTSVLVIPENFSKNFYSQKPVEIAILQDGANIVPINYSSTPLSLVVGNFSARYNVQAALANYTPTLSPAPISMSLRTVGNSVQGYLAFYIYGVMLMAAHVGITLAFGLSVLEDKKNSALVEEFGAGKILFTKEIFYLALSLFSMTIGISFLAKVFDMPFRGEIWQMLLICGIFLFAAENLAGLLGLFFKTRLAFVQAIVFYTLPALLTAGYIWPYQGMPDSIKFLSKIQPVHYALADFRRISLTGTDAIFWQHAGILFAVGIVSFALMFFLGKNHKFA